MTRLRAKSTHRCKRKKRSTFKRRPFGATVDYRLLDSKELRKNEVKIHESIVETLNRLLRKPQMNRSQ